MRDALTRHQQWCAAEGLTGPAYKQQHARQTADVTADLIRLGKAGSADASDAAQVPGSVMCGISRVG